MMPHVDPKSISFLLASIAMLALVSGADAKIRIYGGPVPSAGSGRYYPPGDNYVGSRSSRWINGQYPGSPGPYRRHEARIDLNPLFVPGTAFIPPGYIPAYYPRSSYFAYDYIGYGFGSATAP